MGAKRLFFKKRGEVAAEILERQKDRINKAVDDLIPLDDQTNKALKTAMHQAIIRGALDWAGE